jgi:hypothetical protein
MARNNDGNTPLHMAIECANIVAIRILLKTGSLANSTRTLNARRLLPWQSLYHYLQDRVSLTYLPNWSDTLQKFVTPLVREIYHSIDQVRDNEHNLPAGIQMAMQITILLWNHRLWQSALEAPLQSQAQSEQFTQTDLQLAIGELARAGLCQPDAFLYYYPQLLPYADDRRQLTPVLQKLYRQLDPSVSVITEINNLRQELEPLEKKCKELAGAADTQNNICQLPIVSPADQERYDIAKQLFRQIRRDGRAVEKRIKEYRETLRKLQDLANNLVQGPLPTLNTNLLDFQNHQFKLQPRPAGLKWGSFVDRSSSRKIVDYHAELQKAFSRVDPPMYHGWQALFQDYLSQQNAPPENIGFLLLDYAHKVAESKGQLHWENNPANDAIPITGIRQVVKLGQHMLQPLPSGRILYWTEQPMAKDMTYLIYIAVRGTIGAAMLQAFTHLLTDYIAQNSIPRTRSTRRIIPAGAALTENEKKPTSVVVPGVSDDGEILATDVNVGRVVDTTQIVSDIMKMRLGRYDIHGYLLEFYLLRLVKNTLDSIDSKYDQAADFHNEFFYSTLRGHLILNPYYPILESSIFLDKLEEVFLPYWTSAIIHTVEGCMTALEGWHLYLQTLTKQLEMVATLSELGR